MSPTLAEILKPTVLMARVVWGALVAAVPIYAAVAFVTARSRTVEHVSLTPALPIVCGLTAVALAAIVLTLPRFFPGDDQVRRLMRDDPNDEALARDPRTGATNPAVREALGRLDATERRLLLLRPVFLTQAVVRAALAEAIAMLGYVLTFLNGNVMWVLAFGAASVALQLVTLPNFEPFAERARDLAPG